jgi:phthalate 4,5-cis-dihydrodiol dehydrogenase
VALVGCGEHAREDLLPSLRLIEGVELVALCDNDQTSVQQAAAICPTAITDDLGEKIFDRSNCDAVVLACPPQLHYEFAKKALTNGVHVFVEKPPSVTKQELQELSSLANENRLVTMVGHNLRHSTAARVFHETLAEPGFGRPIAIQMRYLVSGPKGTRWRLSSVIQSFLLSHAIHCIDLLVFQAGLVDKVLFSSFSARPTSEVLLVSFSFRSGAVGNLIVVTGASKFSLDLTAIGDQGGVAHMPSLRKVVVGSRSDLSSRWERVWTPRTLDGGYQQPGYEAELAEFIRAIQENSVSAPTITDELHIYDIMDQILVQNSIGKARDS